MPQFAPSLALATAATLHGDLARYEMKYLVDVALLPELRAFVQLFCHPDPHARGDPPGYEVTTLQFDTAFGALHLMKEHKALNRFKLRARVYGAEEVSPLFLEIKRKNGDAIIKSRASIARRRGTLHEIVAGDRVPAGLDPRDRMAFLEFVRLVQQLDARPVMRVRYRRESFLSDNDGYGRVTFDTALRYMPTSEWRVTPEGGRWRRMDTALATQRPFPAFILELKSTWNQPTWMAELVERFNLTRCDFCKYSTAMRLESLHRGFSYSDASENTTY